MNYYINIGVFWITLCILASPVVASNFLEMRTYKGNLCYDGDTCYVTANILPDPLKKMTVRILGIDTPEIRGKCKEEKSLAMKARVLANKLFKEAKKIEFRDLKWDKYGGRVLSNVYLDNKLYSQMLIDAGLARSYDGGTKKEWCN